MIYVNGLNPCSMEVGSTHPTAMYINGRLVYQCTEQPPFDWGNQYFGTRSLADGTEFRIYDRTGGGWGDGLILENFLVSYDYGQTWLQPTLVQGQQTYIYASADRGKLVMWKNVGRISWHYTYQGESMSRHIIITATQPFEALGNILALRFGDDFRENTDTQLESYEFEQIFSVNGSPLQKADNLIIPSSSIPASGCNMMFNGCANLVSPPALPATSIGNGAYYRMFAGCTSLSSAPSLPATTLSQGCYERMFIGCTSLSSAPSLPVTAVTQRCYYRMFEDCTSLVNAPQLPAPTLAQDCYYAMFSGCTALTGATLGVTDFSVNRPLGCCHYMFNGCSSLTYLSCTATNPSSDYTWYWVRDVASTGLFVKKYGVDWNVASPNRYAGIPENWTVVNDSLP